MNIIVLAGGWSSERGVSLQGAKYIVEACTALGHTVDYCEVSEDMDSYIHRIAQADFAFINVHGIGGEDGLLPAVVERLGIPYQCSNAQGSFLALHKSIAKALYRKHGLPTAPSRIYKSLPDTIDLYNYPLFIKGNTGGSSIGLYKASDEKSCKEAIEKILQTGDMALVEEHVKGIEVSCGVLGDRVLPPVMIVPQEGEVFTYEEKYCGKAKEICPAPLPKHQVEQIMAYAYEAHKALGLFGYSRTDMIVQEDDSIMLLETNTIPGMTATSLFPQEAQAVGISFTELIKILIEQGLQRP